MSTPRTSLVIPQRPKTEIAIGFHLEVRQQLASIVDINEVDEGRRRLSAWRAYVTKREQRKEIDAATRWCEVRLGELLGKAEIRPGPGRGKKRSITDDRFSNVCPKQDRHNFRLLARHKSLVSKLIAGGQVSRGHLLSAIKELTSKPEPTLDSQNRTVASLDELSGETFGCIYADPPWQYGNQSTRASTDNHYKTMTVDALCSMPVESLSAVNSHLHLWTTNAFLFDAKRVMDAWGFEYRSVFVWVKPQMGIGNYWRVSHEFLLLGIRGNAKSFNDHSLCSWAEFKRRKHSSKPEEIRGFIERASPGPYLEMFGRKDVAGWIVMGNQIAKRLFA